MTLSLLPIRCGRFIRTALSNCSPVLPVSYTHLDVYKRQTVATLFDLNNIRNNNIAALTRLQELQNSNGAWSWYKGMNGSGYVTAYIAELNARLALLTGEKLDGPALALQEKALTYLHQSALEEYKNILKAQKEGVKFTGVSGSILQYLYIVCLLYTSRYPTFVFF